MPEVQKYIRVGDTLTNIIDSKTGESVTYDKVTLYADGTAMDDSKCDPAIYRKLGTEYFARTEFLKDRIVRAKWLGIVSNGVTDNTSVIQQAIDLATKLNTFEIDIPAETVFDIKILDLKKNINFTYYGATNEEFKLINNKNPNGTPVNELVIKSPYHPGFLLDSDENFTSDDDETPTKRAGSFGWRRNGFSTLQNIHSALGTQWNLLNYQGIANIPVTGTATSSGNLTITLNGVVNQIPIVNGDTAAVILGKITAFNFGSYWVNKSISAGVTARIFPRRETTITVTTKVAVDGNYPVVIDGVTYNIPVLATDSTKQIAVKIATSPLIPSATYVLYNYGSVVVAYNKAGGMTQGTTLSVSTDVTGIVVSGTVSSYIGDYNRLVITPNGNVGIGLWSARQYSLEVANSMRILSDSDEIYPESIGGTAIFVMENEKIGAYKGWRLNQNNTLDLVASNKSSVIFKIDDTGNVTNLTSLEGTTLRTTNFAFIGKTRVLRSIAVGGEEGWHISNNAASGYILRATDAGLWEALIGGVWYPFQLNRSGTTAQQPTTFRPVGTSYFDTSYGRDKWWNGTAWIHAPKRFPIANTTDVVTLSFLNTTYPVANYPIGDTISYFNQGKEYTRETATVWSEKAITLTA